MGSRDYLKLGDWNVICDQCGFKYKGSELRKRWDGFMVCERCWEPRPAQEYIKGIKDDQTTPYSRPEAVDQFDTGTVFAYAGTQTFTSANLGQDNRLVINVSQQVTGITPVGAVTIVLDSSLTSSNIVVINGTSMENVSVAITNNSTATVITNN